MNITVIALGKLKEEYLRDAAAEYKKRLSAFCKLNIIELAPERLPDEPSESEINRALDREADIILSKIPNMAYVYALCIEGKQMGSEALAKAVDKLSNSGTGEICYIIGSSYGLSQRVKSASNFKLSMSEMTFPHQLARIMLLEQIYRAETIRANRKYHK